MIDRERFRGLLGQRAKDLPDKDIDTVCCGLYSLGYALLEWNKQHSEEDLNKCVDEKRKS